MHFSGNPLYSKLLDDVLGLRTPYEQLVFSAMVGGFVMKGIPSIWRAAWAVQFIRTAVPDKKLEMTVRLVLDLTPSDLPSRTSPEAVARFMIRYCKPAILWSTVPIVVYSYVIHARNEKKLMAASRDGTLTVTVTDSQ